MFDPSIGRWLEEDPESFGAGDANLYRYVRNDPTNATDPSGLTEEDALKASGVDLNKLDKTDVEGLGYAAFDDGWRGAARGKSVAFQFVRARTGTWEWPVQGTVHGVFVGIKISTTGMDYDELEAIQVVRGIENWHVVRGKAAYDTREPKGKIQRKRAGWVRFGIGNRSADWQQ